MSLEYLSVPTGLRDLLKGLTKDVLREKPSDLYEFAALYFESVLQQQQIGIGRHENTEIYANGFPSPISIAEVFKMIPEGLTNLIKDFVKAVLRKQPENIYEFAVQYFREQPQNEHHKGRISHSSILHTTYENYLKRRESIVTYIPCTCGRIRTLKDAEILSNSIAGKISSDIKPHKTNQQEMLVSTKNHSTKNLKMSEEVASVIIQRRLRKLFAEKLIKSRKNCLITNTSIRDNVSEAASYTSASTVEMSAEAVGEAKEKETIDFGITTSGYQAITQAVEQSHEPQEEAADELNTTTEHFMSPEEESRKNTNEEVYLHGENFDTRTIPGILKAEQSEPNSDRSNVEDIGSMTKNANEMDTEKSGNLEKYDNNKISNSVILKQSNSDSLQYCTKDPEQVYINRNGNNNSANLNQYKNVNDSESQKFNEAAKYVPSDEGDKTKKSEFENAEKNAVKEVSLTKNQVKSELVLGEEAKESSLIIKTKSEHRENSSINIFKSIPETEEITSKSAKEDSTQDEDTETLIETCASEPVEVLEKNKAQKGKGKEIDVPDNLRKSKALEGKCADENDGKNITASDINISKPLRGTNIVPETSGKESGNCRDENIEQYSEITAKFSENQDCSVSIVNQEKGSNGTLTFTSKGSIYNNGTKEINPESADHSKDIKELEDQSYHYMINKIKKSDDRNDQIKKQASDEISDVKDNERDLSALVKSEDQHESSTVVGIHESSYKECKPYEHEIVQMENIHAHFSTTAKVEMQISENSTNKVHDLLDENTESFKSIKFSKEFQDEENALPEGYEIKQSGHPELNGKSESITKGNQDDFNTSQTQRDEIKTLKKTDKAETFFYETDEVLNINPDDEKILLQMSCYKGERFESSPNNDTNDQLKSHRLALEILQGDEIHTESILNETRCSEIVKSETNNKICGFNDKHIFNNKEDDSKKKTKNTYNENSQNQFPAKDESIKFETQPSEKVEAVKVQNISCADRLGVHKQESQNEANVTDIINVVKNHPKNKDQIEEKTLHSETSIEHNETEPYKETPEKDKETTSLSSKAVTRTLYPEEIKTDSIEPDERRSSSYSNEPGINKDISIRDESQTRSDNVDNIQYDKISNNNRAEHQLPKPKAIDTNEIITVDKSKNLTNMDELTDQSNKTHSESNSKEAEIKNEFIRAGTCSTQLLRDTTKDKGNCTDKSGEFLVKEETNLMYSIDVLVPDASARDNSECKGIIEAEDSSSTDGCGTQTSKPYVENVLDRTENGIQMLLQVPRENTESDEGNITNKIETGIVVREKDSLVQDTVTSNSKDTPTSEQKNYKRTASNRSSVDGDQANPIKLGHTKRHQNTSLTTANANNEAVGDLDLSKCKLVESLVASDINPQLVNEEVATQERAEIPNLNECCHSTVDEDHANRKENCSDLNPIESTICNNLIIINKPAMPVGILNTIIELNEPSAYRGSESKLTEDLLTQTETNTTEMRNQTAYSAINDTTDLMLFGSGSDNDSECTSSWTCSKETDENVFSDEFVNEGTDKILQYPIRRPNLNNSCEPNQGGIYEMDATSGISFASKFGRAISNEDNLVDDNENKTSCSGTYYNESHSQISENAFRSIEKHHDGDLPNELLEQYINHVTFCNTYNDDQLESIDKTELNSLQGCSINSKVNEPTGSPYVALEELNHFSGDMVNEKSAAEESLKSVNETLNDLIAGTTKVPEIEASVPMHPTELSVSQTNLNDTNIDSEGKRTTSPKLAIASQSFAKSCDKVRNASAKIIQNAYRAFRTFQTKTIINEESKADTSVESTGGSVAGMENSHSNKNHPARDPPSMNSVSPSKVDTNSSLLEQVSESSFTNSNSKHPGEMVPASKSKSDESISQEGSSLEKDGGRGDVQHIAEHHADNDNIVGLNNEDEIIECVDSKIDIMQSKAGLHDFQDKYDVMEFDNRIADDHSRPPSPQIYSGKNTADGIFNSERCHAVGEMYVERDGGILEPRRVVASEEEQLNLGICFEDFKSSVPYRKLEESLVRNTNPFTHLEIGEDSSGGRKEETSASSSEVQSSISDCVRDKHEKDSLEKKTAKLQETEEIIKKMQQRRASETRVESIDDRFSQEERFGEPILISMEEMQKTEMFEMEDDSVVVLKRLGSQCKDSRESSAQSEMLVFMGESKTQYDDEENEATTDISKSSVSKDSSQRLCKIPRKESKVFSKSVSIDDSIKYIEAPESETTTTSSNSFNLDNNSAEDYNKIIRSCSVFEIDSGAAANIVHLASIENSKNDLDISDANTKPTVKAAAIKIQAVARGFLIRRRLRRQSRKAITVESSLEKLIAKDATEKIQAPNSDHNTKNTSCATFDGEKICEQEFSSFESGIAARRHTLQRRDAVRNDSTPGEENFGSKDSASTRKPSELETLKANEKIAAPCRNAESTSSAADISKKINNKLWFVLRQNSMPVQIESEVFRVIPKHMRKRIKSAGCQKQNHSRAFKD